MVNLPTCLDGALPTHLPLIQLSWDTIHKLLNSITKIQHGHQIHIALIVMEYRHVNVYMVSVQILQAHCHKMFVFCFFGTFFHSFVRTWIANIFVREGF